MFATVEQLADWLRVAPDARLTASQSAERDDRYTLALTAAATLIRKYCGRGFTAPAVTGTRTATLDVTSDTIWLPDDLQTLTSLTDADGATTALADIEMAVGYDAGQGPGAPWRVLRMRRGWWRPGRYTAAGDWGWPAHPAVTVQASLLIASRVLSSGTAPHGWLMSADNAVPLRRTDPLAADLLDAVALARPLA